MQRRGTTVIPYGRDYRRPRRWSMGLPPRPPRRPRRWWQKIVDPLFYLRAVIVVAGLALVAIPFLAD